MSSLFKKLTLIFSVLLLSACVANGPYNTNNGIVQKAFDSFGELIGGATKGAGPSSQSGKMVSMNSQNIMIEGTHPTDARWQGKLIAQTSLYHFFDAHPRRSPSDYWPRIAIRIDDYSESLVPENTGVDLQYSAQMVGSTQPNVARPLECLKFTAVIWMSPKQSERIENVVHCNADIKMGDMVMSVGALNNYRSTFSPISMSSQQVRSFGPKSPSKLVPDSTRSDIRLYTQGQHLFSSLFSQMGYRGPLDGDPRVWFVSLSKNSI
jgi:hypothetical protein